MHRQDHASLLRHNTFHIDVTADTLLTYDTEDELRDLLPLIAGQSVLHIGEGSNLLFTGDYHGIVLQSRIVGHQATADGRTVRVRVGAAERWDDFVATAVANGWHGIENLSLIPGQVGAAAVQNIGAYGVEAKDVIESVEAVSLLTGEKRTFSNAECRYAYRDSAFKHEWRGQYAVTHVTLRLSADFEPRLDYGNIRAMLPQSGPVTAPLLRQVIIGIRRAKLPDPAVTGNAGSFFTNPVVTAARCRDLLAAHPDMPHYAAAGGVKIPAGWLIEQCGWRGRSLGPAAVHDRQALVLVNLGGASGQDILALCHAIQHDVQQQFSISLHPEVNIL